MESSPRSLLPDHVPILLSDLYEDSREIILVRDPRDVLCSLVAFNAKRGFGLSPTWQDISFMVVYFRYAWFSWSPPIQTPEEQIETGKQWSRTELLVALLKSLGDHYRSALGPDGGETLLRRVESISSYVRGKRVHVEEGGGYDGVTDGLDAQGFLRVRTAGSMRTVLSGGVRES